MLSIRFVFVSFEFAFLYPLVLFWSYLTHKASVDISVKNEFFHKKLIKAAFLLDRGVFA